MAKKKSVEDLIIQSISDTRRLSDALGDAAFTTVERARIGDKDALEAVQEAVGRPLKSQEELSGVQRFLEGRMQTKTWGPLAATALNLGYEGAKGISQALGIPAGAGWGQGILGLGPLSGNFQTDVSTSPASFENALRTQLGIFSTLSPELRQASLGRQGGGPIPNQTAGNKMGKAKVRLPAMDVIQRYQSGGLVGDLVNQLRNLNVDTSQLGTAISNLQGVGGRLAGFDPFGGGLGGQAAGTLGQMLGTGAPVDVAPITEASGMEAQRLFQDLMGGTSEQFGALGLGSSSARQRALSRGASDLASQVASQGLRAGVGAQEAARGRQMQAFAPFFQGTGQQLTGLTGAGQQYLGAGNLAGQMANIGLAGQTAQTGGFQNLANLLTPIQAGQMNQPAAPFPTQSPVAGVTPQNPLAAARGGGAAPPRSPFSSTLGLPGRPFQRGGQVGPKRGYLESSDRRPEYGDYLSQLLFGRKFQRRAPVETRPVEMTRAPRFQTQAAQVDPNLQRLLSQYAAQQALRPKGGLTGGEFHPESGMGSFVKGMLPPGYSHQYDRAYNMLRGIGIPAAHQGLMQSGRILASLSPNIQYGVKMEGQQGGGKIDGPAVPPDQVPILAQGGEGVIPVQMMDELEKFKSNDPLVRKLQELMGFARGGKVEKVMGEYKRGTLHSGSPKGPKVSDRKQAIAIALSEARRAGEKVPEKKACGGKVKYQAGGAVPRFEQTAVAPRGIQPGGAVTDPTQAVQSLGLQGGGGGTFSQIGTQPDPMADLELARARAERTLATMRAAIATAANPQRATALLTPRIEQAQAEVDRLAGEQDALRARQMEALRATTQAASEQAATEAGLQQTEMITGQRREQAQAEAVQEQEEVLSERQEADRQAFMELMDQVSEGELGPRPPSEAFQTATQMAPGLGIPVPEGADEITSALQMQEAQETAAMLEPQLQGQSLDDLDEAGLTQLLTVAEAINNTNLSREEVMQSYPELFRLANEFLSRQD